MFSFQNTLNVELVRWKNVTSIVSIDAINTTYKISCSYLKSLFENASDLLALKNKINVDLQLKPKWTFACSFLQQGSCKFMEFYSLQKHMTKKDVPSNQLEDGFLSADSKCVWK